MFREITNINILTYYYNVNVLKSLYWLHLIHSFNNSQDINYEILILLLIEKAKGNFGEHSIIVDFLKESCQTNDSRFKSLLHHQDLLSAFELTEIDVMDKIYKKFSSNTANHS